MEIPYTADARPDTGVTNVSLGMWLFIASEVMLFGSLFSSYALLRAGSASWPDQSAILNAGLASLNTVVLLASSASIVVGTRAMAAGRLDGFRRSFVVVIVLGVVFLGLKGFEYSDELGRGLRPSTSNFLGLYVVLTGLHALHLAAGIAVNAWLLAGASRAWTSRPAVLVGRVRAASLYWNFVDVIWIIMFVTLYLL